MSECNWFIVTVRDPRKRKNAKPVSLMYFQTTGSLADVIDELLTWQPSEELKALDAMTIEGRRMTQAEIDHWDRQAARRERQEQRGLS